MAIPLGRYIARVYRGEKHWSDFLLPVERLIYRLAGVDPGQEMTWKQHLKALLTINLVWFVYGFFVLIFQDKLPLNPDGNPGQTPDLAFNTVISFIVNCNLQHYSGESGLTYLTQLFMVMFFQFVSAATGMAALAAVFKAMVGRTTTQLGQLLDVLHPQHHPHPDPAVDHRGLHPRGAWYPDDLRWPQHRDDARRRGTADHAGARGRR